LVTAGSYWQHSESGENIPNSLYAATKLSFLSILDYYHRFRSLRYIELRLFDSFGAGDRRGKFLNLFDAIASSGEPIDMTAGEQLLAPIHIDDVCSAFLTAADRLDNRTEMDGAASYTAPGPELLSLKEIASIYERVRGVTLNINWGGRPYPQGQIMRPYVGNPLPGWHPKINFESGLYDLYKNF